MRSVASRGLAGPAPLRRDALDGVLLLDKSRGHTSNQALQAAKRLLQARKAGHSGTLDPMATGLLPLCFGEATKFAVMLLDADKTYEAEVKLGIATTTGDADGEVIARREVSILDSQLEQAMSELKDLRQQTPPMYSALKHRGRPLYEYARAGVVVERAVREIRIDALDWDYRPPDVMWFRARVSKGTYIRTLAEQVGLRLGCGAHLTALRRTAIGSMEVAQAVRLDRLEGLTLEQRRACLLPVDALARELPAVEVDQAARLLQGQTVSAGSKAQVGPVRLYDRAGRFLGIGEVDGNGWVSPRRLLAAGTAVEGAAPVAV
jgi:tRNA pseudouridine55 synthase